MPVDAAQRQRVRTHPVGAHRLRVEHEEDDLRLVGAQAEGESAPRVVGEDGEVGGDEGGGGGKE